MDSMYLVEFIYVMTKDENDEFHPNMLKFPKTSLAIKCSPDDFTFQQVQVLGYGAFGFVLKAQHKPTGTVLAVKFQQIVFDPKSDEAKISSSRASKFRNMKREINGLRRADSPYVTGYYGLMIMEKYVLLCMELMDFTADDLYKEVRKTVDSKTGRFDEKALGIIATSIIKALLYLKHDLKLMHRDVKPSNILLNLNGDVKLGDLGLACHIDVSIAKSVAAGSTIYISPEILNGRQQLLPGENKIEFSARSDLWSLGVTLVEIARLKHPYSYCKCETETILAISMEDPPILTELDGYNVDLIKLINSCLIQDPKLRSRVEELVKMKAVEQYENLEQNKTYMESFVRQYMENRERNESSKSEEFSKLLETIRNLKLN